MTQPPTPGVGKRTGSRCLSPSCSPFVASPPDHQGDGTVRSLGTGDCKQTRSVRIVIAFHGVHGLSRMFTCFKRFSPTCCVLTCVTHYAPPALTGGWEPGAPGLAGIPWICLSLTARRSTIASLCSPQSLSALLGWGAQSCHSGG